VGNAQGRVRHQFEATAEAGDNKGKPFVAKTIKQSRVSTRPFGLVKAIDA
jgi:hypothetical protein